jgi:restriction endonuclease
MAKYLSEVVADYIVEQVKKNASDLSNGLNWTVSHKEIDKRFFVSISHSSILAALEAHPEVADVQMDQDGFDVVIFGGEE